jgi:hypothetical protein
MTTEATKVDPINEIKEAGKITRLKSKGKKTKVVEVEVEGKNRDEVVVGEQTQVLQPQIMSGRAMMMKRTLKEQKRFMYVLPPIGTEVYASVNIDDVVYESIGEPLDVTINGYKYYVPRGVPVELPESIYMLIKDNERLEKAERAQMEEKRKSIRRLYDNQSLL